MALHVQSLLPIMRDVPNVGRLRPPCSVNDLCLGVLVCCGSPVPLTLSVTRDERTLSVDLRNDALIAAAAVRQKAPTSAEALGRSTV